MESNKMISDVNRGWFAHAVGMAYDIAIAEKDIADSEFDELAKDGGAGGMAVEDFANNLTEADLKAFLGFWEKVANR